jgi:hypothetical protein
MTEHDDEGRKVEQRIVAFALERIQRGQQLIDQGERMLRILQLFQTDELPTDRAAREAMAGVNRKARIPITP